MKFILLVLMLDQCPITLQSLGIPLHRLVMRMQMLWIWGELGRIILGCDVSIFVYYPFFYYYRYIFGMGMGDCKDGCCFFVYVYSSLMEVFRFFGFCHRNIENIAEHSIAFPLSFNARLSIYISIIISTHKMLNWIFCCSEKPNNAKDNNQRQQHKTPLAANINIIVKYLKNSIYDIRIPALN